MSKFVAKSQQKDIRFYESMCFVLKQFNAFPINPPDAVKQYEILKAHKQINLCDCFMQQIALRLTNTHKIPVTNIQAAQYYNKTFSRHLSEQKQISKNQHNMQKRVIKYCDDIINQHKIAAIQKNMEQTQQNEIQSINDIIDILADIILK